MRRPMSLIRPRGSRHAHWVVDGMPLAICGIRIGSTVLGELVRTSRTCRYCLLLHPVARP